ncbi:MAG: hypothetical protein AAF674_11460 [Pseudomonadota bacterium]
MIRRIVTASLAVVWSSAALSQEADLSVEPVQQILDQRQTKMHPLDEFPVLVPRCMAMIEAIRDYQCDRFPWRCKSAEAQLQEYREILQSYRDPDYTGWETEYSFHLQNYMAMLRDLSANSFSESAQFYVSDELGCSRIWLGLD